MNNPYNTQTTPIREIIEKRLPYGLETTADMLLEIWSNNFDEPLRASFNGINGRLYFIATRHKKIILDFADALCEYDFVDAIYITGGADSLHTKW